EVDGLGGHLLGGEDQVALVLAPLVVHHDEHLAGAHVGESFGNAGKGHATASSACVTPMLPGYAHRLMCGRRAAPSHPSGDPIGARQRYVTLINSIPALGSRQRNATTAQHPEPTPDAHGS